MAFRDALQASWYLLHAARNRYRNACIEEGMRFDLLLQYMQVCKSWGHFWCLLAVACFLVPCMDAQHAGKVIFIYITT